MSTIVDSSPRSLRTSAATLVSGAFKDAILGVRREPGAIFAYAALALVLVVWILRTPIMTPGLFTMVIIPKVPLVFVAVGMAVVLISKGIDLSIGSVMGLAYCIMPMWTPMLRNVWLTVVLALLVTTAFGLINGLLVGILKLPALVVTLATGSVAAGIALYICPEPKSGTMPQYFTDIVNMRLGPVPLILILAFLLPALIWFPIRRSRAGMAMMAVGGDEAAAFVSGLNQWRSRALAYSLAGLFAGLAGVTLAMSTGGAAAGSTTSYTLNAIAAAVLGGVALTGGRGSVAGAIGGAFVLGFITSLMTSWHLDSAWSSVLFGSILVLVVGVPFIVNQVRARRAVHA